jgi:predicted nucleic acid-binding protein
LILLDTSGVLAWIDGSQRQHSAVVSSMRSAKPPFLLSPFVLAELDYLLATRVSARAQRALLDEVGRGAYQLETFDAADIRRAGQILSQFEDLEAGLADASIVVLAERHGINQILTLDERHFRTLRAGDGQPFRLLPADR